MITAFVIGPGASFVPRQPGQARERAKSDGSTRHFQTKLKVLVIKDFDDLFFFISFSCIEVKYIDTIFVT